MDDFPVRSAHRAQTVTVGKKLRDLRVDGALVVALVLDNLPFDNLDQTSQSASTACSASD